MEEVGPNNDTTYGFVGYVDEFGNVLLHFGIRNFSFIHVFVDFVFKLVVAIYFMA